MAKLWRSPLRLAAIGMLAAFTGFAQNGPNRVAQPGAVNYVEGNVSIDGRTITNQAVGSAQVDRGQTIETAQGKVELLLTPGIFVRLDDNSALQMVANSLVNTQVQLQRGRAMVEVDQISPENRVTVVDNGITTQMERKGIYEFNAETPLVQVYDGQAVVRVGDKTIDVDKGHELTLTANAKLKSQKFDRKDTGELYAWSRLRSQYMAEANASSAQMIYVDNPWWWYGTGWYWNPWYASWAFVPGAGFLYSPFGFGFYAPVYAYGGFYGYHPGFGYRGGFRTTPGPAFHSGFAGGFHGGGGFGGRR
jgi:hypothetical protein